MHHELPGPAVGTLPVLEDGKEESLKGTSLEGRQILTANQFNHLACANLNENEKSHLCTVKDRYGDWLAKATNVSPRTPEKEKKLKAGIQYVRKWMSGGKVALDETQTYCPSMVAMELLGVQPAIKALIDAINNHDCAGESNSSNPFSPRKNAEPNVRIPSSNVRIPSSKPPHDQAASSRERKIRRTVDFVAYKPGRNKIVMIDSAMRLPIEVKPLFRSKENPENLNAQCKNQIFGHLAKYLNKSFNFRGIGFSSFATGVVCTLCYVQVIQVYLIVENANKEGRGMIRKYKMESNYLPLISLVNFEAWEQKHGTEWQRRKEKYLKKLKTKLYGKNLDGGISDSGSDSGIPIGILALREIMKQPRRRLFGPDLDAKYREVVDKPELQIKGVFGQGAQGVVLGAEESKDGRTQSYVIKAHGNVPKAFLVHESNILKKLGQVRGSSPPPSDIVSILETKVELKVQLGSWEEKVPALLLSPQGVPLLHHLLSKDKSDERYDIAKAVWFQGKEALNYIHDKEILHNDISPKNFIVVRDETLKLCLVDFGTACPKGYELPYFCGTAAYSHDDLVKRYPGGYEPRVEYDKYGLAVTVLATKDGGKPRWDMSNFKTNRKLDREAVLKDRATVLDDLLDEMKKLEPKSNTMETNFCDEVQEWVHWKKGNPKQE